MSLSRCFLSYKPWSWYLISLVIILSDQASKTWVTAVLEYDQPEVFTSFFNFTLRHNPGAAFSIFADGDGWQRWFLGVLAGAVSVLIVIWIAKLDETRWLEALALALVLGGAIGNLYDRVLLGYVIDFIVVHYKSYYWPAFNIADSSIFIGACLLIYDTFMNRAEK